MKEAFAEEPPAADAGKSTPIPTRSGGLACGLRTARISSVRFCHVSKDPMMLALYKNVTIINNITTIFVID